MRKTFLLTIFFMLLFSSSMLYASCNCDTNEPDWYMNEAPSCQIFPHYYTVNISASDESYSENATPTTHSRSASCTEYWSNISDSPDFYSCKTSVYNPDGSLSCSLFYNSGCYGSYNDEIGLLLPDDPGLSISGSWDDETFTGSETISDSGQGWSYNYSSSTTITAVFSRPPVECLSKPVVNISHNGDLIKSGKGNVTYTVGIYAKPQNDGCCEPSPSQVITVSCGGASHMKVDFSSLGDSEIGGASYIGGCSGDTHRHSDTITIGASHNRFTVEEGQIKKVNINYKATFYDFAGNNVGSATILATITTECPEERK